MHQGIYSDLLKIIRNISPVAFLRLFVFRTQKTPVLAAGFKVMYFQLARYPEVSSYIRNSHFRIIHLMRRNLFHALVSLKTAEKTGLWHSTEPTSSPGIRLTISVNECRDFFASAERDQKRYIKKFSNNPVLSLYYEDLRFHKTKVIPIIEEFLGVERLPLRSVFRKINRDPKRIVTNYSELKRTFSATRWSRFFT